MRRRWDRAGEAESPPGRPQPGGPSGDKNRLLRACPPLQPLRHLRSLQSSVHSLSTPAGGHAGMQDLEQRCQVILTRMNNAGPLCL